MNVAIVNYGMGNIGSVRRAFEDMRAQVTVADHPGALDGAHRIVLPGVGAFGEAMARLRSGGWVDALRRCVVEGRTPMLGICLGMQMLAESSEENGLTEGLGFVSGRVRRLDAFGCSLRIPHVGWNEVRFEETADLFAGLPQAMDFYFVHSYGLAAGEADNCALTSYGTSIAAAVQRGHVFGTQFHPEKSSKAGRQLLQNFLNYTVC